MKTCLHAEWDGTGAGKLIDLSFVDDDHEFGLAADGTIHIEGHVASVRPSPPPASSAD